MCFCRSHDAQCFCPSDDADTLKAMLAAAASEREDLKAEVGRLARISERAEARIAALHAIIKQLERARFGRSSEKLDADQQAFAFEEVETGLGAVEAELDTARPANDRRRSGRSRKAFPAHLERVEVVIEPDGRLPLRGQPWRRMRGAPSRRLQGPAPGRRMGRLQQARRSDPR